MNELTSDTKVSLSKRIISALIMVVLGVPCLLFGNWYFFAAVVLMEIFSVYEVLKASSKSRFSLLLYGLVYIFVLFMTFSPFMFNKDTIDLISKSNIIVLDDFSVPLFFTVAFLIVLFFCALFSSKLMINDVCYLFSMGFYISIAFLSIMYLRYLPNQGFYYGSEGLKSSLLFTYILLGTCMNDIGAYAVGVLFGKHKMCPRISPHKTWEGFAGGVVFSLISSFFFAYGLEQAGYQLLPGIICFADGNWWRIVTLSVIIPFVGDVGDLMFSLIKRNFGIKDFGTMFPGHGGVLDRLDSLTLVSVVSALFVYLCINGWRGLL